jgi:hypothetical protein
LLPPDLGAVPSHPILIREKRAFEVSLKQPQDAYIHVPKP